MDHDLTPLADRTRSLQRELLANDYVAWLGCLCETHLPQTASQQFLRRYPHSPGAHLVRKSVERLEQKSAVLAGTTTDSAWASPLVSIKPLVDAFVAIARSASLLGRIPNLRRIGFKVKCPFETVGATFTWPAENAPKPVSTMAFSNGITLDSTKLAAIIVLSRELVELAVAGLPGALKDTLVGEVTAATDRAFLDPASAAISTAAEKRPASITSGTVAIPSTGNYATDVQTLLTAFFTARPGAADAVLVVNAGHAAQLRAMNAGGGVGLPVIVSDAALTNTIAIDPQGTFVADAGIAIDISTEAALQMDSAPDQPVTATTVVTSLWQNNLAGFRVERFVGWQAVSGACKYLAG
jgi:Phage capsid family